MTDTAPSAPAASVAELYRAVWAAGRDLAARRHLAPAVEIGLIVLYVVLRSSGLGREALVAWVVLAALATVVAPSSGLVVLAAIAPFSEPFTLTRSLGAKPVLVVVLGASVAVRLLAEVVAARRAARPFPRPPVPLALAAVVGVGTLLGVVNGAARFGRAYGIEAGQLWIAGVGGAMVVLGAAYWSARRGDLRPLVAAVVAATVGGIVSLVDWLDAEAIRGSAVSWLVRPNRFESRLTGVIPSPNGVASMVIVAVGVLAATVALARDTRLRVAALVTLPPLALALYFTYSRAALLGLLVISVIIVWRIRRAAGIVLLLAGVIVGAAALPSYLQTRFDAVGGAGSVDPSGVLVASDRDRLRAWQSASAMFLEEPLIGHGFQSYRRLHEVYGDPILSAPHNEWLRLFAEEGFIVGLAGAALAVTAFLRVARASNWVAVGCAAGFAGWAIAATFNNPWLFIQVSAVAFTVVGTGLALAGTERRAPPTPDAAPAG